MKTIVLIIITTVTMLFVSLTVSAQNYKTQFPAKMDNDGSIKDSSGTTFITISKDSIIKNHLGEKIAFIDRNGNLVDQNGKILGKAAKNGEFHNVDGQVEFTVKDAKDGSYCEVYDKTGKHVLTVPANYKNQASTMAYIQKQQCMLPSKK